MRWVPLHIVILFVVLVAALTACGDSNEAPEVRVQDAWQAARLSAGHLAHTQKGVSCTQCHSADDGGLNHPTAAACIECHEKQTTSKHAGVAPSDCLNCHVFRGGVSTIAHDAGATVDAHWTTPDGVNGPLPWDCLRCHAQAQGDTPGVQKHISAPCQTCHKPHGTETVVRAPCADCHKVGSTDAKPMSVPASHAKVSDDPMKVCAGCHQHQHAAGIAAASSCPSCHTAKDPKAGTPQIPSTATFDRGHVTCITCHKAHEFKKATTSTCTTCHAGKKALSADKVPAHQACTSCHSPHDVKQAPQTACANCHKSLANDHPMTAQGKCTGCHQVHAPPNTFATLAKPCSTCHQTQHDASFHARGVVCTKCHTPHHFKQDVKNVTLCTGCHGAKTSATAVAKNGGHVQCTNCHEGLPHKPVHLVGSPAGKPCIQCHGQKALAVSGKHTQCTTCHDAHSGVARACAGCHADKTATAHAATPGCPSCHEPHHPFSPAQVPSCASCHKTGVNGAKIPVGLHLKPSHGNCTSCHEAHKKFVGNQTERTFCTTCHKDRANHMPNAQRCSGCHLFKSP